MATDNYCYPGKGEGTRGGKRGRPQDGCQGSGPCATFVSMAELSYGEEQPSNNRAGGPYTPPRSSSYFPRVASRVSDLYWEGGVSVLCVVFCLFSFGW